MHETIIFCSRWRCGYCKVTTVQELSMKMHQKKKHSTSVPLIHEIIRNDKTQSPKMTGQVKSPYCSPKKVTLSSCMPICNVEFGEEDENCDLFECRLCGLVGNMKELYVHNYNAHPHNKQVQVSFKGGKRFHCTEVGCNFKSQAVTTLRKHFESLHPNKRFTYKIQVIAQPEIVDDNSVISVNPHRNKKYRCPTCEFASDLEAEVLSHLKSHLLYKCLLCSMVFSSAVAGKSHVEELHGIIAEGNLIPIMSSDLITKNSPPVKVIYTARKSTALGGVKHIKRQVARKSTSRLPNSWKSLIELPTHLDSNSLSAKEFSFYGKPKTAENFNSVKTSLVFGNRTMNLTVAQFAKLFDISPKLVLTDLKNTPIHS